MKAWLIYDEYHDEINGVALSKNAAVNYLLQNKIDLDTNMVGYHDSDIDEDEYVSVKIAAHWENCSIQDFLYKILSDKFEGKYWFPWQLEETKILD